MAEYSNVADELDAIIGGSYDEVTEEDAANNEANNNEDTDHTEDDDTGAETNDQAAELGDDTDEGTEDDGEENTPVDDGSSEGLDGDDDGTEGEKSANSDDSEDPDKVEPDSTKDDTEPDGDADGADPKNTDVIDYQKQYEELLEKSEAATKFYDSVAGVKFKANGKEVEGFKDPKKIIQAQQMAYNYSEKMAGFKQYRPYMGPLKDRGMLEDSGKFDLAMSLIDGDKEALKQHIQNLGLDPMDLDMEDIKYDGAAKTASRDVIAIEDALESARASGVEDKVYNTVMKEWDDDSFRDFVGDQAIQSDLIAQMADGTYDVVMGKVTQMGVLDDRFSDMKMVDKYRTAINELNKEAGVVQDSVQSADDAKKVEADRVAKIEADAVAAYKAGVNKKKNDRAKIARDKANAASKPKPTSTDKKSGKIDPMELDGSGIANFLDGLAMGKK